MGKLDVNNNRAAKHNKAKCRIQSVDIDGKVAVVRRYTNIHRDQHEDEDYYGLGRDDITLPPVVADLD